MTEPTFMVFDTETTGLDPGSGARILELGAVVIDHKGMELRSFETLFSFTTRVSIDGSHIHGIFPGMLEDAPVFLDAVGNFIEFAEDSLPVAHNAPFDAKFLQSEFQHAGLIWPDMVVLDSLRAARRLLKGHSSYSLASLTRDLGMEFEGVAHCALADARMTSKLMAVLLERTEPRTWPSPPAWPLVTHRGLLKAR